MVGEAIQMYRLVVSCLAPANILDGVVSLKDPSGLYVEGDEQEGHLNFDTSCCEVIVKMYDASWIKVEKKTLLK